MSQVGEKISHALPAEDKEECIFCGKNHQEEKPSSSKLPAKNTRNLKKNGQAHIKGSGRLGKYPNESQAPLVNWESNIEKTKGYKAAAHHCLAYKCAVNHVLQGELADAGYDPDGGNNCILLPYSEQQFSRARAYFKPLQKHRGGHTGAYFKTVDKHIDQILKMVSEKFCTNNQQASKEKLLRYAESQENALWNGVANVVKKEYQLYNDSYLDPRKPWGNFSLEKAVTRRELLKLPIPAAADDAAAEAESADDPE